MHLDEKVKYLKNAIDENKLIIFVGAGVSKNSNLPDWEQLIRVFIDKLNYPIGDGKTLSSDEYLKIPQYYYNMYGSGAYEKVIKEELDIDGQPNDIHELIFKLNPTHIITTNYDRLLESTTTEKRLVFNIISKDKDLLDSKKGNHIIKMHGDIKELENIVLKEDDYLNYSQTHILIETYIKSLLVNHSFLFIGYSLNDYNLKQIISWVDYLAKDYTDLNDRPKHFIVQETNEAYEVFIEDYYKKKNIFIINPNEIDNEYINSVPNRLTTEPGKKLYGTLMYIKDYPHQLIDKLYYGALQLEKLRRVSIEDLLKIYRFKFSEVLNGDTLLLRNIDEKEYLVIEDIISKENTKERLVKETLIRSGLKRIVIRPEIHQNFEIYNLSSNDIQHDAEFNKLFKLELQCDYVSIENIINSLSDKNLKAFYLFKLQEFEKSIQILDEMKYNLLDMEIYDLSLYRFNLGLLKQLVYNNGKLHYDEYRDIYHNIAKPNMLSLNYLNQIFNSNSDQKLKLSKLKEEHLRSYLKLDNSVFSDAQNNLYQMITIVYDYYFYIKNNGIFLDYFNNMDKFFEPYIEAILSTYSPKTMRVRTTTVFPDHNEYPNYILNIYDWDILIKHTEYKKFREFLNKYEINQIQYDKNFNIIKILSNLCQYIKSKPNRYNIKYLKNFILLLTVINFEKEDVNKIIKIIEDVLIAKDKHLHIYIFTEVINDLNIFINDNIKLINENSFKIVIEKLFTKDVYNQLNERNKTREIFNFLNSIKPFSYNLYKDKIDKIIEENNFQYILGLTPLLSPQQKKLVSNKIYNNIDTLEISKLIDFILANLIEYNELIENKILDKLKSLVSDKIKSLGIQTFPNPLEHTLELVVLLFLLNKGVNIEKFQEYAKYYDVLDFIINPIQFDYEKIEFDHYNWVNVLQDEELLKIIIHQGKPIIKRKLKYNIANGFANEEQTRLYYKYFE